ncbi:MAG: TylF/MycF/NovP-related O-methyltransferase [Pseudomonadota bacterium]
MPTPQQLERVHAKAPLSFHLATLYGGLRFGEQEFLHIADACFRDTRTPVMAWKLLRRMQRAYQLSRYFIHALGVPGARCECGVFRGFSALLLTRIAQSLGNPYPAPFHLVDSFEGLSAPTPEDALAEETAGGGPRYEAVPGQFATPMQEVAKLFRPADDVHLHKGWLPGALDQLPETQWAFVHVDVDLYEPTLACLEYFMPRLAPGAVLINDDYASPLFPGGGKAWDEYFLKRDLPFITLDSGQSVYVHPA